MSSWSGPSAARGCLARNARTLQSVHAHSPLSGRSLGQKADGVRKTRFPFRQMESDHIHTDGEVLKHWLRSVSWEPHLWTSDAPYSLCSLEILVVWVI